MKLEATTVLEQSTAPEPLYTFGKYSGVKLTYYLTISVDARLTKELFDHSQKGEQFEFDGFLWDLSRAVIPTDDSATIIVDLQREETKTNQ